MMVPISGTDSALSHLETAPTVTPNASANCSWVSLHPLRMVRMFSDMWIFTIDILLRPLLFYIFSIPL